MSRDNYIKIRGIVIILVGLCISFILWEGQILKMLNSMSWGMAGMGFAGILYGLYTTFMKKKA